MCALTTGGTRTSAREGHMSRQTWERVLELAVSVGKLNLSGWGENFSNPSFLDMLRELDTLGVPYNFNTNGTAVTPEIATVLAGLDNLFQVNISIDSPDPRIYREIRGVDLTRVLDNLRLLSRELGSPNRVTVSSVVMEDNIESLADFPAVLEDAGVTGYFLQGMLDLSEGLKKEQPGLDAATVERIRSIRDECRSRNITVDLLPYLQALMQGTAPYIWGKMPTDLARAVEESRDGLRDTRQCLSPWDHIFVNRDGEVMPCCICPMWKPGSPEESGVMGNINDGGFQEVWASEKFTSFRKRLLEGPPPGMCANCPVTSSGPHFYELYQGAIDFAACNVRGERVHLFVENTGRAAWTTETRLDVGTALPRDRQSSLLDNSWINPERVATIEEARVEPSEKANIHFVVSPEEARGPRPEVFQLVADRICWIRDTQFEVRVEGDRRGRPRARVLPWPRPSDHAKGD